MAAHTCISRVWEAEVREPLVLGQLGLRGSGTEESQGEKQS